MSDPSWRDVNPRRPAPGRQPPPGGRSGSQGRGYTGRDGGPPARGGYPGRGGPGGRGGYTGRGGPGDRNGYASRDGRTGRGGTDWGMAAGRPPRRGQGGSVWRWGAMAGWVGVFIVAVATLLGIIGTLLAKRDPGTALGVLVIIGTIAAVFAVRPRAAYVIIPVPALSYVFGALVTGYVHDKASDTSHAVLVLNAAQWVAAGFTTMAAATLAALVVAVARWALAGRGAWRSAGAPGAAAGMRAPRAPRAQGTGYGTMRSVSERDGTASGQEPDPYAGYYDDGGSWR